MKRYRKALVALATVASTLLAYGLVPDKYVPYVLAALGALGALGVYHVPNAPAPVADEANGSGV